MKKIEKWYEELPEYIKIRALKNRKVFIGRLKHEAQNFFEECNSLHGSIMFGFNWFETPEGPDFWEETYKYYNPDFEPACKRKKLPPPPIKSELLVKNKSNMPPDDCFDSDGYIIVYDAVYDKVHIIHKDNYLNDSDIQYYLPFHKIKPEIA